jgi:hypothetical protein
MESGVGVGEGGGARLEEERVGARLRREYRPLLSNTTNQPQEHDMHPAPCPTRAIFTHVAHTSRTQHHAPLAGHLHTHVTHLHRLPSAVLRLNHGSKVRPVILQGHLSSSATVLRPTHTYTQSKRKHCLGWRGQLLQDTPQPSTQLLRGEKCIQQAASHPINQLDLGLP